MKKPKKPEGVSRQEWDDMDIPEWTAADFKRARPAAEVFPEIVAAWRKRRGRGPQKAPTKKLVSLRLDRDVLERFRKTGKGWQGRVNKALRASLPPRKRRAAGL